MPQVPSRGCSTQHPLKGKGKRPRYSEGALRPSFQTARADQKYYDDLAAGIKSLPGPDAYAKGQAQRWPAPPNSVHRCWHRENLLRRLRRLEARGVYPTAEENNQAINLEQLINYLEENYPPGAHRPGTFRPTNPEADLGSIPEGGRPTSKVRSSVTPSTAGDADSEGAAPAPSVDGG